MTSQTLPRVHAVIPWAVLESVRTLDAPPEDGMEEFHQELAVKRLGTSRTVATQIDRFRALVNRGARVDSGEAVAFLRLVGRRSDAALVFTDAGRRAARWAEGRVGVGRRLFWRLLPGRLRHRFGMRIVRRLLHSYFDLSLATEGTRAVAQGRRLPSVDATADGSACKFFGAAAATLLAAYTAFDGAMVHDACVARGSEQCRWHAAGSTGR